MANILAVGIATLDIINELDHYPGADSETRATSQRQQLGGNASNSLHTLKLMGHHVRLAACLANDPASHILRQQLTGIGIQTQDCITQSDGQTPTSCITLALKDGSRSIIHHRRLNEYSAHHFRQLDLSTIDWLHLEGRDADNNLAMLQHARQQRPSCPISVEIEKPRHGIEALISLADTLIYGRHYLSQRYGLDTIDQLNRWLSAQQQQYPQQAHIAAWGQHGASAIAPGQALVHQAAETIDGPIDSLAAGDVFNAAIIHALIQLPNPAEDLARILRYANRIAAAKCQGRGYQSLQPAIQTTTL